MSAKAPTPPPKPEGPPNERVRSGPRWFNAIVDWWNRPARDFGPGMPLPFYAPLVNREADALERIADALEKIGPIATTTSVVAHGPFDDIQPLTTDVSGVLLDATAGRLRVEVPLSQVPNEWMLHPGDRRKLGVSVPGGLSYRGWWRCALVRRGPDSSDAQFEAPTDGVYTVCHHAAWTQDHGEATRRCISCGYEEAHDPLEPA